MRFPVILQRSAAGFLSGIVVVFLLASALTPFMGGRAQAAQASAQITCLSTDGGNNNGPPEAFALTVGTSASGTSYEGGYPVFECLGGQNTVIAPTGTSPSLVHTVTASCPTANVVFEQKSVTIAQEEWQYVVAHCNPVGETLTITAVQDPPGINPTQYAGEYPYSSTPPPQGCPPNCGQPELPPECEEFADNPVGVGAQQCIEDLEQFGRRVPERLRELCDFSLQHDEDFDYEGCVEQAMNGGGNLFSDAITRRCTLLLSSMPTETEEDLEAYQEAYAECEAEYLELAGIGEPTPA